MVYMKMVNSGISITLHYSKNAHAQLSHSQPQRANCGPASFQVVSGNLKYHYLSIHPSSIHPSIHPSIYLSIYLSIDRSIHRSIYQFVNIFCTLWDKIKMLLLRYQRRRGPYISAYLHNELCTSYLFYDMIIKKNAIL